MIEYNESGQLEVIDEAKFNSWLNSPKLKHTKRLDYNDKYIQIAIKKFNNAESFKVYNYLRMYYWQYCKNYDEFEEGMEERLDKVNNVDELFKM